MIDSHIGSTEARRNILDYLKSLRYLYGDLDVEVKSATRTGILKVRGGQVVAAECGMLEGNGAFLTLAAAGACEFLAQNRLCRLIKMCQLPLPR